MTEPWIPLGAALRGALLEAAWPTFSIPFCGTDCAAGLPVNAALSVTAVVAGAAVAYMGRRRSRHHDIFERVGGVLLIAGFSLLGYSLEVILGAP